ncbi:hypothetical protein ACH492_32960 [Streptomyces sp. NPDC019443]|uniref:hypothetical protein n=1 Tax=Streptomyces sp. NPDC019443 TaxID=3365061 RepID=UPI00378C4C69
MTGAQHPAAEADGPVVSTAEGQEQGARRPGGAPADAGAVPCRVQREMQSIEGCDLPGFRQEQAAGGNC